MQYQRQTRYAGLACVSGGTPHTFPYVLYPQIVDKSAPSYSCTCQQAVLHVAGVQ